MSTHKKIEWALFIIGLIGFVYSVVLAGSLVEKILFALIALFAGLHVFHIYDGRKSNQIVATCSLGLVIYTAYLALAATSAPYIALGISILLTALSFRLRKDFKKK